MIEIALIAHDIRSCHNVGSLLRTADGLGVQHVYLTGYTPYPKREGDRDERLPHLANKIDRQIRKTALGAELSVPWEHYREVSVVLQELRSQDFLIAGLEQASEAIRLPEYKPPKKIALLLGREAEGLDPDLMKQCEQLIEIPMFGQKESFNVVQAAAIALSKFRY